jgi:hypothetical protein
MPKKGGPEVAPVQGLAQAWVAQPEAQFAQQRPLVAAHPFENSRCVARGDTRELSVPILVARHDTLPPLSFRAWKVRPVCESAGT